MQKLLQEFYAQNLTPIACKPIETGVVNGKPQDAMVHLELMQRLNPAQNLTLQEICPYQFGLPAAPWSSAKAEGQSIDTAWLKTHLHSLAKKASPLLLEGAGGLLVPIRLDYFMIDLARDLNAHLLLIFSGRLGGINELLLSIEALKSRQIPHTLALNLMPHEEEFYRLASEPFLHAHGLEFFDLNHQTPLLTKELLALI